MSEDIRKMIDEVKNFGKLINENDKPPSDGKKILYKLTDDDYSYVPYELKYLGTHVDRTLFGTYLQYLNNVKQYQTDITNLKWFFIYYKGKRYIYNQESKSLKDKNNNRIESSKVDDLFIQQMNQIIDHTLKPRKPIEDF